MKAEVSIGIRSKAVVTVGAPRLSPEPVVGLSIEITIRVDYRQDIPTQINQGVS